MKKLIYTLLLVSAPLYAQNTVFKCVDASGNVSYINTGGKNTGCEKTEFNDPTKGSGMVVRSEDGGSSRVVAKSSVISTSIGNIPIIKTEEQKKKDEGRNSILSKELQDEEEQLASVKKMLQNVIESKDSEQITKLKDMEGRHQKNISSLKRELGIKDSNVIAKTETDPEKAKLEKMLTSMIYKKEIKPSSNVAELKPVSDKN